MEIAAEGRKNLVNNVKEYFKNSFKFDLVAGIVVALIALPLAVAFSVASGARPEQGLYTSIIAGIIIGLLSGSNYQVSGPTGAFVVILLDVVNHFGLDGLMVAGFMAGVLLLLMGIFQLGSIIKYIPYPVTVGFTAGIGVIIFTGQIKDFFGVKFEHRPHDFIDTLALLVKHLSEGINVSSVIIAAVTLIAFLGWKKFVKKFPPSPFALFAGIVTSVILSVYFKDLLPAAPLVGEIPTGLPQFTALSFSWEKIKLMFPAAFTIAMLGAIESLLSAVVADGMPGPKHNSNKELIAQGIGNMVLPFFNGIPATGAIARTAANIRNGGRTRMSSIIHGLVLLFILLIFGSQAQYIPLAALAVILMMVAYNMAEIPHFLHLLKSPPQDAFVLVATFLLTVFTDLTMAVGFGIVLAAVLFIQRVSNLSIEKFNGEGSVGSPGSKRLHASLRDYPEIILYEVAGPLFFGVASEFENRVQHNPGEVIILRMKHVSHMDATGIHALEMIVDRAIKKNGHIFLSTLSDRLRVKLEKVGILQKIGGAAFAPETTTLAVEAAKKIIDDRRKE